MLTSEQVIEQTKKWINDVVIGCNFCPFAAKVVKQGSIHYQVEVDVDLKKAVASFLQEAKRLDEDDNIETIFLIFPNSFEKFDDYLDLVELAEKAIVKNGYEGIYQVASFHPLYTFASSTKEDAADYTNRSIYPMLHLLREASIDAYMKLLRDNCLNT